MERMTIEELRALVASPRDRGRRRGQLARAEAVLQEHPEAVLCVVSDEFSGVRFGAAQKRKGRCLKLGGTTYRYQLWASWSEADL